MVANIGDSNPWPHGAFVLAWLGLVTCGGRTPLGNGGVPVAGSAPPWVPPAADGTCPEGTSLCGFGAGAKCYDLEHDPMNCGRCDEVCTPGIACSASQCQQRTCEGPLSFAPVPPASANPPEWPRCITADMNGDGKPDLVEWGDDGQLRIETGNGDGTFSLASEYPAWEATQGYVMDGFVVPGDFNEDGNLDLAVSIPGRRDTIDLWLGNGDGTLRPRAPHGGQPSSSLAAGDANRDGHLDVVVNNVNDGAMVVLLGRGDGTFSKSGPYTMANIPVDVTIRDWDGDGLADLVTMGTNLNILFGIGDGRFAQAQDCALSVDFRQTVIADFDRDGRLDVATMLHPNSAISVMLGTGRCTFRPRDDYPTPGMPYALVSGDLNGDGIVDLVEADVKHPKSHMLTLLGKGDGTFTPSVEWNDSSITGDILIGDFDGDGRADILGIDGNPPRVQRNTCE